VNLNLASGEKKLPHQGAVFFIKIGEFALKIYENSVLRKKQRL
jgi:hypothetical protein